MMKFMFAGHLFRFFRDQIIVVVPNGDKFMLRLTQNPDSPFLILKLAYKDVNKDHEQLDFQHELMLEMYE